MIYLNDYTKPELLSILAHHHISDAEVVVEQFLQEQEQRQHSDMINTRTLFEWMRQQVRPVDDPK